MNLENNIIDSLNRLNQISIDRIYSGQYPMKTDKFLLFLKPELAYLLSAIEQYEKNVH